MENLSSLSYRQLQKKCKSLGLSCKGKREVLENSIREYETSQRIKPPVLSEYEQIIYDENPEMYFMLKKFISSIPEDRPKTVLNDMEEGGSFLPEEQNKWRIIVEELSGMFHHPNDVEFMERLQENNVESYMKDNSSIPSLFFKRYPAMGFILSLTTPRGIIVPLLLSIERLDLLDLKKLRLSYRDVRYVRNKELLKELMEEYPSIANRLKLDYALQYPGTTLLYLLYNKSYMIDYDFLSEAAFAKANEESSLFIFQHREPTERLLIQAIMQNNTGLIRLILQDGRVNPDFNESRALRTAAAYGQEENVKLLLKDRRSDPSDRYNEAIKSASMNGHGNIVKLLLSDARVDPTVNNNEPLRLAEENGYEEVVEILLQDERVHKSNI